MHLVSILAALPGFSRRRSNELSIIYCLPSDARWTDHATGRTRVFLLFSLAHADIRYIGMKEVGLVLYASRGLGS